MGTNNNAISSTGKPFIYKDGCKWYIQFWYKNSLNERKAFKRAYKLNKSEYIIKRNGKYVEINKTLRKEYANTLIIGLTEQLQTLNFNTETKEFDNPDKTLIPLSKYLNDFVDYTPRKKRGESTKHLYRSYNNVINQYFTDLGQPDILLNAVTRETIVNFLDKIELQGQTSHRDNYLIYLKSFFKYCVEYLEILPKNPIKLINAINANDSKSNKAYPEPLLMQVLDELKKLDYLFWLFWRVIYYTLRRPSEILKVRYKDVDFEKGTVDFESDSVKTHKHLYAYLPPNLLNDLKEHVPNDAKPNDYFFGNTGKMKNTINKKLFAPIKSPYDHFYQSFSTVKRHLKLEKGYTLYSMKHTGVVYMVEVMKWTDTEIIQHTGHTDILILGRYSRDAKRERKVHTGTI